MRRRAAALAGVALMVASVAIPAAAAHPGENGRIAFMRLGGGYGNRPSEIFSVRADGSGLRRLTNNDQPEGVGAFSPSGRRLAFSVGGDTYDSELYVMDGRGRNRRRIVDLRGGNGSPSWSPDGDWIVFFNVRPRRRGEVFIVRPDGSGLTRLTDTPVDELAPDWSPDGDRIAVISDRGTGTSDVWTMNARGSDFERVTRGATVCRRGCEDRYGGIDSLDWAPGGNRIVFSANKGDGPSEIWIVHESGRRLRKLAGGRHPAWSPDGRWIAYSAEGKLYKIRIDGTARRRLTNNGNDYMPDWGRKI
ncbi:MAG: hypothetical protein M3N53_00610 [Actinomycetota bacterium]|nr:hypothetical protein [Actinomycetota bacterium]